MRVSIFKCVKAPKPQVTDLDKIVYMMQFSTTLCHSTQIYRQHLAWQHKKKAKDMKISFFPAFCPCAMLNGGKGRRNVMGLTDLCYLDIDHIKGEKKIKRALAILREDRNVLLAARSVSDDGIHILIRYQIKHADVTPQSNMMSPEEMQQQYKRVFDILGRQYQQMLNLKIDRMAGHVEHLFIVSHDLDLYYNPYAEPLLVDLADPNNADKELAAYYDRFEK